MDDELISRQWVLDVLAEPVGVEDTEFAAPSSEDLAEPATFD